MNIAVIGTGPVGLATADALWRSSHHVVLIGQSPFGNSPDRGFGMRATCVAAAAFWTPFSSGLSPCDDKLYSERSLEFYKSISHLPAAETGIVWRTVKQFWPHGSCPASPPWQELPDLQFQHLPDGEGFQGYGPPDNLQLRCECSYLAPVVQVDQFLRWYRRQVTERTGVTLIENIPHPLRGRMADNPYKPETKLWAETLLHHEIDVAVVCTGVGTVYSNLVSEALLPHDPFNLKKGVVARIPARVAPEAPVLLYEGQAFDRDSLYLVPHEGMFVLGGTVHPVPSHFLDSAWDVHDEEIEGIRDRARAYLPQTYVTALEDAGLWDVDPPNARIVWRAGVRPVLNEGPYVGPAPSLSAELTEMTGRHIGAYLNFGHGGSGFTFFHDTAHRIANMIGAHVPA